ncbi:MAG: tetratricopeptide repeat protein [Pyrinomonadaceae bacterium]
MKVSARTSFFSIIIVLGFLVCVPFVSPKSFGVNAQNRISGFVFGVNRQPMGELYVELVDEYYRTVSRTKTNASGRYSFSGMEAGRFTIRANASSSVYEDGEATTEFQNFTYEDSSGRVRTRGYANELVDVHLKLRKGITAANAAVFVQDVPPDAKKLYEKAIDDLDNKRNAEALNELKAAVEKFPKYYAALERLGTEYVKLARPETFQAAAILFKNAVDVNPRAFKSWYGLAYSRYSLGAFPEAVTAIQKAIELNGGSSDAVFLLGVLMKSSKRYDEAEKHLLKAKELAKDTNPRINWELATLYGNILNRYADAARELRLFLKTQPDSKDAEKVNKLIADFEAKAAAK